MVERRKFKKKVNFSEEIKKNKYLFSKIVQDLNNLRNSKKIIHFKTFRSNFLRIIY